MAPWRTTGPRIFVAHEAAGRRRLYNGRSVLSYAVSILRGPFFFRSEGPFSSAVTGFGAVHMRTTVNPVSVTVLAVLFGMSALAFGWWIFPVVGMVWGSIIRQSDHPVSSATVAAAVGAIGLVLSTGVYGPVADFARLVGGALPLPMPVLYVVAIVACAVLGGTGGMLVSLMRVGQEWDGQDRRSESLGRKANMAAGAAD